MWPSLGALREPRLLSRERHRSVRADWVAPDVDPEGPALALLERLAADEVELLAPRLLLELVDEPRDLDRAWELARRYDNHPTYDLLYVALAERRRTRLITADAALRRTLVGIDRLVARADFRTGATRRRGSGGGSAARAAVQAAGVPGRCAARTCGDGPDAGSEPEDEGEGVIEIA